MSSRSSRNEQKKRVPRAIPPIYTYTPLQANKNEWTSQIRAQMRSFDHIMIRVFRKVLRLGPSTPRSKRADRKRCGKEHFGVYSLRPDASFTFGPIQVTALDCASSLLVKTGRSSPLPFPLPSFSPSAMNKSTDSWSKTSENSLHTPHCLNTRALPPHSPVPSFQPSHKVQFHEQVWRPLRTLRSRVTALLLNLLVNCAEATTRASWDDSGDG